MSAVEVMVVDDDPFICEVLAAALGASAGVRTVCFCDPAAALVAARARRPDILVLDYLLPGCDGLAVLSDFRQALSPLPAVVFLTARDDEALIAKLRAEGAGVLAKPFDAGVIAREILRYGPRVQGEREARLAAVAAGFKASLPETMSEIDKEWSALRRDWQQPVAESLLMRVHKLAGAAGLFKLPDFGDAARRAESAVRAQLDNAARGQNIDLASIEHAVADLWDAAVAATGKA